MNTGTVARRKGRKYDQVVEGARRIFLRDGFDGASVDDIARAAEVSKATLYSYFPDKRLLFIEIARQECLRQAEEARNFIVPDLPVTKMLTFAATRIAESTGSTFTLSIFRLCAAEAERFPELAQDFYDNGPALAQQLVGRYLADATARGELRIDNIEVATLQFIELARAGMLTHGLCCPGEPLPPVQIETLASEAVKTFMARYGPA